MPPSKPNEIRMTHDGLVRSADISLVDFGREFFPISVLKLRFQVIAHDFVFIAQAKPSWRVVARL
jgi:hypothetical protein